MIGLCKKFNIIYNILPIIWSLKQQGIQIIFP